MNVLVIKDNCPIMLDGYTLTKVKHQTKSNSLFIPFTILPEPIPNIINIYGDGVELPQGDVQLTGDVGITILFNKIDTILICYCRDDTSEVKLCDSDSINIVNNSEDEDVINILESANDILKVRQQQYGSIVGSFKEIASLCNLIFTREEISDGIFTPQKVVKVMIAVKQIRDKYSPANKDHIRDIAGYTGILEKLRKDENYYE